MNHSQTWQELFSRQDHIRLALLVRTLENFDNRPVRALADDRVLLLGGAQEQARLSKRPSKRSDALPECVIVTPEAESEPQSFQAILQQTRDSNQGAELAGFGPLGWGDTEGLLDRLVVRLGQAGKTFTPDSNWRSTVLQTNSRGITLVFVYTPDVTAEAISGVVRQTEGLEKLKSVVALPLGAGDRIPLPGLTTSGSTDVMVLSALRHLLPQQVRVRASWAALGWKVAQLALLYGADELAGWTAAEAAVYSGRVRAAARVENEELECGLNEAGVVRVPWHSAAVEATR
jgi:hypothetical protein